MAEGQIKTVAAPPPQAIFRAAPGRGGLAESFVHAWTGLIHTVVHQRNMRVHLLAGVLVGLVGCGIPLGLAEKVTMIFCVLLIFFAEILNTALEHLVDLAVQQFDEKARLVKDAAAAGVLVLAIGTVVIFAAILVHNAGVIATHGEQIQRQVMLGVPLTMITGALMHETRKPWPVDAALFAGALALLAALLPASVSYVLWAMTAGLVLVASSAAWSRQRARRAPQ
ncbi:MAG: diacylglycerol kinase family protein [Myxococcaceae bacterium]